MTPSIRTRVIEARRQHPDRPISECYWDARRHEHFVERMTADLAAYRNRSKAAKAAWRRRKKAAQ